MRRFHRVGVSFVLAGIMCVCFASIAAAAPCTFNDPPETLGEIFTECEAAANCEDFRFESMTTSSGCPTVSDLPGQEASEAYHIKENQFEIDQMGVFKLGLDFLTDADANRGDKHFASNGNGNIPGVDDWAEFCTGRLRFTSVVGNPNESGPPLIDGTVWGYYATERPADEFGAPMDCDEVVLSSLHRPGVLYLPGYRNFATPAEAAKMAALWSTKYYQPENPETNSKVFVVVIAPPSHLAWDMVQTSGTIANEEFHTLPSGLHLSAGRVSTFPGFAALEDHQHRYLLDGFLGENPVQPARNFAFAYGESSMRAVNLFDKFFAPQGWTSNLLHVGGFSIGGWLSLIQNEALQAAEYTQIQLAGVFTFAAHAGLDDNFRVPGNNMGYTIVTSGAPLVGDDADKRPYIAWDCDGDLPSQFSQPVLDRMEAGCRLSRYFSPLRYYPSFDERPILLTQGSADQPWGLRGLQRTFGMYSSYLGADNALMQLAGDVDHGYFLGARGGYDSQYREYFLRTPWLPSEGINDSAYVNLDDEQSFDPHLDDMFESFVNADILQPRRLKLDWNRVEGSIRNFILSNAGSGIVSEEIVPPPPSPIRPSDSAPGVDIAMSSYMEDGDKIYRYEMTACYDEDLPYQPGYADAEFEIFF